LPAPLCLLFESRRIAIPFQRALNRNLVPRLPGSRQLGVLQADFTGGEPLARTDIIDLVRAARSTGLYVNLITSGLPLDETKLAALVAAGLDHVQLSFQGAREELANEISGTKSHAQKLRVLEWVKQHRVALTLNFVIHRRNIDQLEEMVALAESSSARALSSPTSSITAGPLPIVKSIARARTTGSIAHSHQAGTRTPSRQDSHRVRRSRLLRKYPKPCMGGWGRKLMLITPSGDALPCHAAQVIPGLSFENVNDRSLREIWEKSASFQKFRGEDWMQEPCKTCDRREQDFGGCRCQALLLAETPLPPIPFAHSPRCVPKSTRFSQP